MAHFEPKNLKEIREGHSTCPDSSTRWEGTPPRRLEPRQLPPPPSQNPKYVAVYNFCFLGKSLKSFQMISRLLW